MGASVGEVLPNLGSSDKTVQYGKHSNTLPDSHKSRLNEEIDKFWMLLIFKQQRG
jgi:hypothetical protein